jgi:hypothetical protein
MLCSQEKVIFTVVPFKNQERQYIQAYMPLESNLRGGGAKILGRGPLLLQFCFTISMKYIGINKTFKKGHTPARPSPLVGKYEYRGNCRRIYGNACRSMQGPDTTLLTSPSRMR